MSKERDKKVDSRCIEVILLIDYKFKLNKERYVDRKEVILV